MQKEVSEANFRSASDHLKAVWNLTSYDAAFVAATQQSHYFKHKSSR